MPAAPNPTMGPQATLLKWCLKYLTWVAEGAKELSESLGESSSSPDVPLSCMEVSAQEWAGSQTALRSRFLSGTLAPSRLNHGLSRAIAFKNHLLTALATHPLVPGPFSVQTVSLEEHM
jgi:hypothetical protein